MIGAPWNACCAIGGAVGIGGGGVPNGGGPEEAVVDVDAVLSASSPRIDVFPLSSLLPLYSSDPCQARPSLFALALSRRSQLALWSEWQVSQKTLSQER